LSRFFDLALFVVLRCRRGIDVDEDDDEDEHDNSSGGSTAFRRHRLTGGSFLE
jgi:hypothetical protein